MGENSHKILTHQQVWTAIDALAKRYGLSPSGLARRSGLDPTAFNRSKRVSADGRERWPSTDSVAKILDATGAGIEEFMTLLREASDVYEPVRAVPLIGFSEAGEGGFFDDGGFPSGNGWESIAFPEIGDEHAYALEVTGNSMLPLYREGDVIIVSPAASVRRGDRVVVKTRDEEVMAKILKRRTATHVELNSFNPDEPPQTIAVPDIEWMARIMWASQ